MTNAGNLLALLRKYQFDFVFHGHKHKPNFETHIVSSSFPLAILCAGSFSVQLDTRWSGHVNNQFHLIRVEGRDAGIGAIYGRVESWTSLCDKGWQPSTGHNGIRHVELFGAYLQPAELGKTLRPIIESKFSEKQWLEWSDVIREVPQLKYLPADRVIQVIDSLSTDIGFRRRGEPPDDIILTK